MVKKGVICGGCWLVDKTKIIDRWPEEESLAVIHEETLQGGGPAMNMAVNLKRLGGGFPVAAVGAVGDDHEGRRILEVCGRYGIDTAGLCVMPGVKTSYTDVMTNRNTGKRTFFHCQGAGGLLTPEHFDFSTTPEDAAVFHLGAPGIHDAMDAPYKDEANGWAATLKKARAAGLRANMELISLPPERIAALARPCLPHLNTIIINDAEVGALAGMETVRGGETDLKAVERAAYDVLDRGVSDLAAVHFPGGCLIARPGKPPHISPSVKVPPGEIVSSVGAGDAFASGLMFGLIEQWPLEKAVALAHAAAAACLRSMSTHEAFGPAGECLALAEKWGVRPQVRAAVQ